MIQEAEKAVWKVLSRSQLKAFHRLLEDPSEMKTDAPSAAGKQPGH